MPKIGTPPVHTHAGNGAGGQIDWDQVWADAIHSHGSNAEGGQLAILTALSNLVHTHASDAQGGNPLTAPTITGAVLGGTTDVSGGQLKFPATQSASTNANALDDYEEGDWTPAATFGGAAVGMTFSKQEGTYTKLGRLVAIHCDMRLSAKGTSVGNVAVTGLPFTMVGHSPLAFYPGTITFADAPLAYGSSGGTTINLEEITNAGVGTNLTNADFADTSMVFLGGVYMV